MAIFSVENRLFGAKRESVPGDAETILTEDVDVRVREMAIDTLEVEFSESDKYATGDHTRATRTPGLARGSFSSTVQFAVGEWIATGTAGAPVWEAKLPYAKMLESNGLIVNAVPPTDENSNDGYWEFYPEKAGDCQTITASMFDISTCGSVGGEQGIEYKLAGAMSTLVIESTTAGAPFNFNFVTSGKVSGVKKVTGIEIPEYEDDNALFTQSAKLLLTDIILTPVNRDGSDITPVIVDTYEMDGVTPVVAYEADGVTPVDVYDIGRPLAIYDDLGDPLTVYDDQGIAIVPRDGNIAVEFDVNTFSLDTGVTQAEIKSQADAYGIKISPISERAPMFQMAPLLEDLDYWQWWSDVTNEKVSRIEVTNYKDEAKTIPQMSIIANRCQLTNVSQTDEDGYSRLDSEFEIKRNVQGADKFEKQHVYTIRIYGDTVNHTTV